jgi:hypothetical protein
VIKLHLHELVDNFGGKICWIPFRADYILDDIELNFTYRERGGPSYTTLNVKKMPEKHIWIELSPKKFHRLNQSSSSFKDLYSYENHIPQDYEILTQDIKIFITEQLKNKLRLQINRYEYYLNIDSIKVKDMLKGIEVLFMIKENIAKYEANKNTL